MRVGEMAMSKPRVGTLGHHARRAPPKLIPAVWTKEDWAVVYRVVAKIRARRVRN